MMVKLADLWKSLNEEERGRYKTEAENDKIRYLKELDYFWKENPSEMIQNKTKKNHVKKPCSAYALYLKEVKQDIKDQNPNLKMADVLKIVSEKWKVLDKGIKAQYESKADKEKEKARAKLGEKILTNNDASKEISLKKKKARQQNEIRKQIKIDNGTAVHVKPNPISTPNPLSSFYFQLDRQQSLEKILTPQTLSLETAKSTNESLSVKDEFIPSFQPFCKQELLREIQAVPLLQNTHQINSALLEAQKSLVLMPSSILPREPSKPDPKASLLLQLLDQSVRTSNDYLIDLLNFSSNSGRIDSGKLYSINSNPFNSALDFSSFQPRAVGPKPSRAQVLNSAIVSALGMETEEMVKKEEDGTNNNSFFDLPKLE